MIFRTLTMIFCPRKRPYLVRHTRCIHLARGYTIKLVSHQLAKSLEKIVRLIAKQSLFDFFLELSRAGKMLALVQGKIRTSSGRNIGKITIKHASHQLAQYRDKVVRITFLIMFDPLCILISFTDQTPNSTSPNNTAPLIHARALPPLFANPCSSITFSLR